MTIEHHDLPGNVVCPYCASIHDCAMGVSEDPTPPEDGNINICIKCARISVYAADTQGGLRIPSEEELAEAIENKDVRKALMAINRSHYHIQRGSN